MSLESQLVIGIHPHSVTQHRSRHASPIKSRHHLICEIETNGSALRYASRVAVIYCCSVVISFLDCRYGAGYDLAARRKNATRESTATLKAWLNEHKKNPYPTKGEKIMLAIITKMTLTQVSTWFANARRRLKKENKMTWEPKNKTDDDDDALVSDSDEKEKDDDEKRDETGECFSWEKEQAAGGWEFGFIPNATTYFCFCLLLNGTASVSHI